MDNLIDAIENGLSQASDLGERIHERKTQYDLIAVQKDDLERKLAGGNVEFINRASILAYVDNLRDLLQKGTVAEQRSFLKSFVKRIDVFPDEVKLEYRIPVGNKKTEQSLREVLPSITYGGAD
jgi:site-specific DNA recombinase